MACSVKARQVGRVVREVGVHLEDVVIAVIERPLESCDVGGAEAQLAAALHDEEAVGKLRVDEMMHYLGCSVGASVVDDEDVEALLEGEDGAYNLLDVFLFVICGDDYDAVAFVHTTFIFSYVWLVFNYLFCKCTNIILKARPQTNKKKPLYVSFHKF